MADIKKLENELWEAANNLRTNSKLTSQQHCMPVLGLIFLRYAWGRPEFLVYYLASPLMQSCMLQFANGKGASRNALTKEMTATFEVLRPPLEIQDAIVDVLYAYDNLIENNRKQIKLLEEATQRLYREWFIDLNFPGHEDVEIVDDVPEGWQERSLGKCIDEEIGGGWGQESSSSEFSEIGYVIRATDMADIEGRTIESVPLRWHKASNISPRTLEAGDLIFEVSDGSREHGVGRSMLVTQEELDAFERPVICASFCKRIRSKAGLSLLLAECLSYEYNTKGLHRFEKRSTGNIINYHWKTFLDEYAVLIPDEQTLAIFEQQVGLMHKEKSYAAQAMHLAGEACDRLLPKLMSGEIEA